MPYGAPPGVPGGSITAVKQDPGQLDVFYTSGVGMVVIYVGTGTDTWDRLPHPTYGLPGAPLVSVPKVMQPNGYPTQVDLLVPAPEHVYVSYAADGGPWSSPVAEPGTTE